MKTLYLSIIIGSGIITAIMFGLVFFFQHPLQVAPQSDVQTGNDYQNYINNDTTLHQTQIQDTGVLQNEKLNQIWDSYVEGEVLSISDSHDAGFIAVGTRIQEMHADDNSHQGTVYFFDKSGNMLWKHDSTRKIDGVSISSNGKYIMATGYQIAPGPAGIYENPSIYFFDSNGTMLWKHEASGSGTIWGASISDDGSFISTATDNHVLYFDKNGTLLWEFPPQQNNTYGDIGLQSVTMTPDGSLVAASSSGTVFLLDNNGRVKWKFATDNGNGGNAIISKNGKYVYASDAVSGYEGNGYYIDASNGNLLWKHKVGGPSLGVGISDGGSVISVSTNWQIFIFDSSGRLLGQDNIPSDVKVSPDGSFVAATSNTPDGEKFLLFDKSGNIMLSSNMSSETIQRFSLSDDSKNIIIGVGNKLSNNRLIFYELPEIPSRQNVTSIPKDKSDTLYMSIKLPNNKSDYHVNAYQGQSISIPWNLITDNNHDESNLELDINSSSAVSSWIQPKDPYTIINGIAPDSNKTIVIHVEPTAKIGNYTFVVTGTGDEVEKSTGWLTPIENHVLSTIHLTVTPYLGMSLIVGPPDTKSATFCIPGHEYWSYCESGPIIQEFPITVTSQTNTTVHLSAENTRGGWVKFIPEKMVVGPDKTGTAKMILTGNLEPYGKTDYETPLIVKAISHDTTQTKIIPVIPYDLVTILHNPEPIKLPEISTSSNAGNAAVSGVVYDPQDNRNDTMPVSMSVLGMIDGNKTSPLPPWLSVDILTPSFDLNATEPFYFMIVARTNSAPPDGTYYVAIDENIQGQHFIEKQAITLENITH